MSNSFFRKDFVSFLCKACNTRTAFDELPKYSQAWFEQLSQEIIRYLSECETGETEEYLRAVLTATREKLLRLGMEWMDIDSNCVYFQDLLEESHAETKKQIDCGSACGTVGQQCQACLRRMFHNEVLRREAAQAEVEMLRGIGCDEDGDGSCGCCLKCFKRERDNALAEIVNLEKQILDQRKPVLYHDEHAVNGSGKKDW